MVIGDNTALEGLAAVLQGPPADNAYGLVVRPIRGPRPAFHHIASPSSTVTVKAGAGTLARIVIATCGGTGATVTLYDGIDAGGQVISVVNLSTGQNSLVFDLDFATGLTYVTSSHADIGDSTLLFS